MVAYHRHHDNHFPIARFSKSYHRRQQVRPEGESSVNLVEHQEIYPDIEGKHRSKLVVDDAEDSNDIAATMSSNGDYLSDATNRAKNNKLIESDEGDETNHLLDADQSISNQGNTATDDNSISSKPTNYIRGSSATPASATTSIDSRKRSSSSSNSSNNNKSSTLLIEQYHRRTSAANRLTMLDESSISTSNKNNNSINSNTNNDRETILSTAQQTKSFLDRPIAVQDTSTINQNHNYDNNNQTTIEAADRSLLLLAFSSILFFLLLLSLIIYKWFYMSRKSNVNNNGSKRRDVRGGDKNFSCDDHWLPQSAISDSTKMIDSTNKDQDLRKRAGLTCSAGNSNNKPESQRASSEQIQLFERRPQDGYLFSTTTNLRSAEEGVDAIQIIDMLDESVDTVTTSANQRSIKRPISTMVTLRRKLNKSSLFVAAKATARPKVRLISDKVRRFIDDEAEDLRAKSAKRKLEGKNPSMAGKMFSYILTSVASTSQRKESQEECRLNNSDELDGQSVPLVVKVDLETRAEIAEPSSCTDNQIQDNKQNETPTTCDIVPPTPPSLKSQNRAGDTQTAHLLGTNSSALYHHNLAQKISPTPSPLGGQINDACSSISGCSLFSVSPMQANGSTSPCNCTLMNGIRHNAMNEFGLNQYGSQCQSPYPHSAGAGGSGPSPIAVYRPCCSTSPSALLAQKQISLLEHHQQQQQQPLQRACYLYHHQKQLLGPQEAQRARVNSAEHWHRPALQVNEMHLLADKSSSSSNRIKRQYENYYDDEREDAYRRLTASIGMELGFGLGHHPNQSLAACVPNHHHRQVDPVATAPAAFATMTTDCVQTPAAELFTHQRHQQHQPQPCKYCTINQMTPIAATSPSSNLQPPNASPYLLKSGGSAGELISTSGSTSLGGSDSGFVVCGGGGMHNSYPPPSSSNFCRDPLCACRAVSSVTPMNMPAPPMSILVQQPSFATPPPPVQPENTSVIPQSQQLQKQQQQQPMKDGSDAETGANELVRDEKTNRGFELNAPAQSPLMKSRNSTRWKNRRRLSQRGKSDLYHNQALGRHCPDRRMRRVSIAGDLISGQMIKRASAAYSNKANQVKSETDKTIASNMHLQHRASIASTPLDTRYWTCKQEQHQHHKSQHASSHPMTPKVATTQHPATHSYQLQHNHTEPLFGLASKSHRPSDASLYEIQSCSSSNGTAFLNGKSSYSSSTSSGIGVSGSACTNTPTACAFPYSSFALGANSDMLTDYSVAPHLAASAAIGATQMASNPTCGQQSILPLSAVDYPHWLPPQRYNPTLYNLSHGVVSGAQAALDSLAQLRDRESSLGASRKYSLPVQLESHAAERLSPNRARPLFEKNLNRVDSVNAAQAYQKQFNFEPVDENQLAATSASYMVGQYPASQQGSWKQQVEGSVCRPRTCSGRMPLADSRRSSQTITRQSSFWLDEDTTDNRSALDSMMSMCVGPSTSCDGQQSLEATQCKPASSSQRPSLGSLVLSGDSIESVKQRPIAVQSQSIQEDCAPTQSAKPVEPNGHEDISPASAATTSADDKPSRAPSIQSHLRNRLSSSTSTSSNASSPSPDFSKPSERILALASKSSSISKRHLLSKLHRKVPKRLPRLGSTTSSSSSGSTNTEPVTSKRVLPPLSACTQSLSIRRESSEDADTEGATDLPTVNQTATITCVDYNNHKTTDAPPPNQNQSVEHDIDISVADGQVPDQPARPIADLSSASLERQCRDLWKLRATLHNDSCLSDNWSNYHQRLNRRYDSGYKSVDNQLSSSLENNIAAIANLPQNSSTTRSQQPTAASNLEMTEHPDDQEKKKTDKLEDDKGVSLIDSDTQVNDSPVKEANASASGASESGDKLAELELEDPDMDCLVVEQMARDCHSRSKGSSGDEERKKTTDID